MPGEDQARTLSTLRAEFRDTHTVIHDPAVQPGWRAWRLDGTGTMLTGAGPGELAVKLRADRRRPSLLSRQLALSALQDAMGRVQGHPENRGEGRAS